MWLQKNDPHFFFAVFLGASFFVVAFFPQHATWSTPSRTVWHKYAYSHLPRLRRTESPPGSLHRYRLRSSTHIWQLIPGSTRAEPGEKLALIGTCWSIH